MSATFSGARRAESRRNSSTCIRIAAPLPIDELAEPRDGIEVLGHDLLVADGDAERFLDERDQLQDAGRVDDPPLRERIVERQGRAAVAEQEILDDELFEDVCGTRHYATSSFWMNRRCHSWAVTAPIRAILSRTPREGWRTPFSTRPRTGAG